MSVKLMSQVWELALAREQQSVLLALSDHAHDDGSRCYPGVDYLAWKTGYDRRSVQRILRRLEAAGLIVAVADRQGARGQATEYRIDLSRGTKKEPFQPRQQAAYEGGRDSRRRQSARAEKGDKMPPFSELKGDKMPPFSGARKGDIPDAERVTSAAERAAFVTQKGVTHAAPTIRNRPEPSPEPHTHAPAAAGGVPAAAPGGVGVTSSKFTFSERLAYARNQSRIENPEGFAGSRRAAAGEFDEAIGRWRAEQEPGGAGPAPDTSSCPDCRGVGFWYPQGVQRGAAKCRHPRLGQDVAAGSQARGSP